MSDDIVDTLRRNALYIPTSRINSFGRPQMGFELTSFNLIAADEIERLREALRIEQEEFAACCIDRNETQRERDDARREVERLRAGGCARDQRTTQYCAEAVALQREVERLRRELGQVSDADSWVSEADAAHLDSLLNWCEFNDMESHRALQRLVNDRARLRGEVTRLRSERDGARAEVCLMRPSVCLGAQSAQQYAESRGWDCFKDAP
jgi:chromosome segregation ATPase